MKVNFRKIVASAAVLTFIVSLPVMAASKMPGKGMKMGAKMPMKGMKMGSKMPFKGIGTPPKGMKMGSKMPMKGMKMKGMAAKMKAQTRTRAGKSAK